MPNRVPLDPCPASAVALALIALIALSVAPPASALAPELATAQEYFYDADFEFALETLETALATGSLTGSDLRDAHVLGARCHARLGDEAGAIDEYCSAVTVDPAWNPDPTTFSTDELALFRRALASCPLAVAPESQQAGSGLAAGGPAEAVDQGGSWYKSKKVWIGAGALVLLLAVAAANGEEETDPGGGGGTLDDVPDFPDAPSSPRWAWRW